MTFRQRIRMGVLVVHLITFVSFSGIGQAETLGTQAIQLITPKPGEQVIAKRPEIRFRTSGPITPGTLLVLLDNMDVTQLVIPGSDGFSLKPVEILASGSHLLTIEVVNSVGEMSTARFPFNSRQTASFDKAISNNTISTVYETVLGENQESGPINYSKLESNLNSRNVLSNRNWEVSLETNARYFDQTLPVGSPLKKGAIIADYLLKGKYARGDVSFLTEIGDITVDQTANTVQYLARKGVKISAGYRRFQIDGFLVQAPQEYGEVGMHLDDESRIYGISGALSFFNNRLDFKTIYVAGREEGESFGLYTPPGPTDGDVVGFVLKTDFFEQKLVTEAEVDFSRFDPDASDEFSAEESRAMRFSASGSAGPCFYEANYQYTGAQYEIVGNQGIQKDIEGISFQSGCNFGVHGVNFSYSNYWDNVEDNDLYPRYVTQAVSANYGFYKFQRLPIQLGYQKSIQESRNEPDGYPVSEIDTDMLSAGINYTKDLWSLGFQPSYSIQNDKSPDDRDTTSWGVTVTPGYQSQRFSFSPSLSFNRSTDESEERDTDVYTFSLNLRTDIADALFFESSGSYSQTQANDDTIDQDTYYADVQIGYRLDKRFWKIENTSFSLRFNYNGYKDHIYHMDQEEFIIHFVFTNIIRFSL
jgi:hypothetical protein